MSFILCWKDVEIVKLFFFPINELILKVYYLLSTSNQNACFQINTKNNSVNKLILWLHIIFIFLNRIWYMKGVIAHLIVHMFYLEVLGRFLSDSSPKVQLINLAVLVPQRAFIMHQELTTFLLFLRNRTLCVSTTAT